MPHQRFVGYCRSSTGVQLAGLELQRDAIRAYLARVGGELVGWFEEIRRASPTAGELTKFQPALARAIECCRDRDAVLLVARLDRLTRSTALLALMLEEGTRVIVVENPRASTMVLQIYAAVAEEFRLRLSRRVRSGIAAATAAGRRRNPHAKELGRRWRREAKARAGILRATMEEIRRGHPMSVLEVAAEMNRRGLQTCTGGAWGYGATRELWARLHRRWHSRRFPGRPNYVAPEIVHSRISARLDGLRPHVERYRAEGAFFARDIMLRLNADGIGSARCAFWTMANTYRLLEQLNGERI